MLLTQELLTQIMQIPRLQQRLDCMLFRRRLELDLEDVRPDVNIVRKAAAELSSSARFKRVLQVSSEQVKMQWRSPLISPQQVVLTVGNALNGSSFRGGARGFQLDALLKVRPFISFQSVAHLFDH